METEAQAIYDQALLAGQPHTWKDGAPYVILGTGQTLRSLEELLPAPTRIRAAPAFLDPTSFATYVGRFQEEASTLFASEAAGSLTCVLDYHQGPDAPSWGSHVATLRLTQTDPWREWVGRNGRPMGQVDFAEWLEDRVADIAEPDGASVLEAALHLEAKKTVRFASGLNLTNGAVQLTYHEGIESKGKGELIVPTRFVLRLSPYEHTEPVDVPARLRFRISPEGVLTFTFRISRPEDFAKAAFGGVVRDVEKGTGLTALFGEEP